MRRFALASVVACGLVFTTAVAAAAPNPIKAGRPVAEVLRELNAPGLHFIYSSQLLPDSLRVQSEVSGNAPSLAIAREILRPHGLRLVPVGATLYAIAQDPESLAALRARTAPTAENRPAPAADESPDVPPQTVEDQLIVGERHPFGWKAADDALLYSATRLGTQPVLGEDALVSLTRMPGISQGDLSGRLNIRGGGPDETLILLDGFPLRQPWHMPGYRSVLSLIDPSLLSQISVYQGAIPARYGDRMSGVLDLQTLRPFEEPRYSLGAGFLNARGRGDFPLGHDGDDDLLLAARYGATGYLVQALEPAAGTPRYGDAYGRLRLAGGGGTSLVFNALLSRDSLTLHRSGLGERTRQNSSATYFWVQGTTPVALPSDEGARLQASLGHTGFHADRSGSVDSAGLSRGELDEQRDAGVWDLRLRLDWSWHAGHLLEAGVDAYIGDATLDYDSNVSHDPDLARALGVPASNSQNESRSVRRFGGGVFLADNWALTPKLNVQAGTRLMWIDSPTSPSRARWDPRLNATWQALPQTSLRAGWGRVHQLSDLTDISLQRVMPRIPIPQRTEYTVAGVDQSIGVGTLLRVEVFDKRQRNLLSLDTNLLRTPSLLPELSFDRFFFFPGETILRGVETTLQQQRETWRWSLAWAWSTRGQTFAGSRLPRRWDGRENGSLAAEKQWGAWLLSGAVSYRGSQPTLRYATNAAGGLQLARFLRDRQDAAVTVDLRAKWRRPLGDGWLSVIGQVSNLFDTANCCTEFVPGTPAADGTPQLSLKRHGALPAIPWFGISWDF